METKLTKLQAYNAMINFLENYYEKNRSDDLAVLLGGMQISQDGRTWDQAAWEDWIDSIKAIPNVDTMLTKLQSLNAMVNFLKIYYNLCQWDFIEPLLKFIKFNSQDGSTNSIAWQNWLKSISHVLNEEKQTNQQLNKT